mmetsp:Transcript_76016/g.163146  ORF Transcript_76016/g.163146 Transcript_76016/m.163146 type:complete len:326 (+) Transcript_76016:30-1007(+)
MRRERERTATLSGGPSASGLHRPFGRNHTDDMRGRDLQLLVHLGAQVLVEELLKLLVLLLHAHSGVDGLATLLQELVISLQEAVQGPPHPEVHIGDDVTHPLPELPLLTTPPRLPVRLTLTTHGLGPCFLLLVGCHVGDAQVLLLKDEILKQLQYVVCIHHEGLIVLILPVVEDTDKEVHVLLTLHTDVPEDGIDLEHIPLLRRQADDLLPHLQVEQELGLLLDEIQNLLDLRRRVLPGDGLTHLRGLDGGALPRGCAGLREGVQLLEQLLLFRGQPLMAQLLLVQQAISLEDLRNETAHFLFVHLPNFTKLLLVRLLKVVALFL